MPNHQRERNVAQRKAIMLYWKIWRQEMYNQNTGKHRHPYHYEVYTDIIKKIPNELRDEVARFYYTTTHKRYLWTHPYEQNTKQ